MTSRPNSPASGGANFAANSAAARFTSLSSDPTIAWMFAVVSLVLVLGTPKFFARAKKLHKAGVITADFLVGRDSVEPGSRQVRFGSTESRPTKARIRGPPIQSLEAYRMRLTSFASCKEVPESFAA